jgi:cyclic pyranopterin monophosphate synthase
MTDTNLSHLDEAGRARMVDVGDKPVTQRMARARGQLICAAQTLQAVREGTAPKGAVITTAEIAGIMAAKKTSELIPLCHALNLSKVAVVITPDDSLPGFIIESEVRLSGQTGVEMEALTAVSLAGLTLYDMLKAIDKGMVLQSIELVQKTGGRADALS